jgi:phage N-6-adenine-methyltransferase
MTAAAYAIRRAVVRLECSACGAEANASCNCAKPYVPAKDKAVAAIKATPEKSDRAIAADIGVSAMTVNRARKSTVTDDTVDERIGLDGKTRKMPTRAFAVLSSSRSVQWYTPPDIVELVNDVLGAIDLDPCWHPESAVSAATTYVEEQDGLSRPWRGRVFLNPPYGRAIDPWIEKLVAEHSASNVREAVALVPARVDTEWFRRLDAFPRCFIYGRLTFANAENPAPFPCAAVYLGADAERFASVFGGVGGVWVRFVEGAGP